MEIDNNIEIIEDEEEFIVEKIGEGDEHKSLNGKNEYFCHDGIREWNTQFPLLFPDISSLMPLSMYWRKVFDTDATYRYLSRIDADQLKNEFETMLNMKDMKQMPLFMGTTPLATETIRHNAKAAKAAKNFSESYRLLHQQMYLNELSDD
ncbi:hypothetical protein SNEBB_004834 [Seison nebaliae]|nr:hypothetical protein SNEBB_004834 [Seison nebaliae]